MDDARINPGLPDWIKDHLRRYIATGGDDGHVWNGVPTLLLTEREIPVVVLERV